MKKVKVVCDVKYRNVYYMTVDDSYDNEEIEEMELEEFMEEHYNLDDLDIDLKVFDVAEESNEDVAKEDLE